MQQTELWSIGVIKLKYMSVLMKVTETIHWRASREKKRGSLEISIFRDLTVHFTGEVVFMQFHLILTNENLFLPFLCVFFQNYYRSVQKVYLFQSYCIQIRSHILWNHGNKMKKATSDNQKGSKTSAWRYIHFAALRCLQLHRGQKGPLSVTLCAI